ncbi:hypothetical protein [Actinocorallia populi]|uniref:hypothetical protein n=1 Tax=Actinocorallia populi TaxID=2079200 RepID=UPI000D088124|nr:hypothetical protein [Actinocorallia populi]
MTFDPTMTRIGQGVELHHHQGHREAARELFAQIWDDIGGEQGDPLHVCVLAHSQNNRPEYRSLDQRLLPVSESH